ncbi:MAG: cytochrome P450 [Pelistega sp.]|nr:cytochrome P450 [Pelistega sp.]
MSDVLPLSDDVHQASVASEPITAYDQLRQRCPVMHDQQLHWALFKHADVLAVVKDHQTFSSVVSRHVSVPNGMDQPEHMVYRALIEPYFNEQHMAAFEPVCRQIADDLVKQAPKNIDFEFIADFARVYAVQVQCAFLGWPESLYEPLNQWVRKNHQATLAQDRPAMSAIALEFDGFIRELLDKRRKAGAQAPDDLTTALMRETVDGKVLPDDVIVSILRNWTVGELGTIAACVGILVKYLAKHTSLQQDLRHRLQLLPPAIDEILRIHPPLIANRRVTTKEVNISGQMIPAGERLTLLWASANRDEAVFGDPDEFSLARDPALNLLYGEGIHICPGAPLARLVLRLVMEELLRQTARLALSEDSEPIHAKYPAGGFDSLSVKLVVDTCCGGCA